MPLYFVKVDLMGNDRDDDHDALNTVLRKLKVLYKNLTGPYSRLCEYDPELDSAWVADSSWLVRSDALDSCGLLELIMQKSKYYNYKKYGKDKDAILEGDRVIVAKIAEVDGLDIVVNDEHPKEYQINQWLQGLVY